MIKQKLFPKEDQFENEGQNGLNVSHLARYIFSVDKIPVLYFSTLSFQKDPQKGKNEQRKDMSRRRLASTHRGVNNEQVFENINLFGTDISGDSSADISYGHLLTPSRHCSKNVAKVGKENNVEVAHKTTQRSQNTDENGKFVSPSIVINNVGSKEYKQNDNTDFTSLQPVSIVFGGPFSFLNKD